MILAILRGWISILTGFQDKALTVLQLGNHVVVNDLRFAKTFVRVLRTCSGIVAIRHPGIGWDTGGYRVSGQGASGGRTQISRGRVRASLVRCVGGS